MRLTVRWWFEDRLDWFATHARLLIGVLVAVVLALSVYWWVSRPVVPLGSSTSVSAGCYELADTYRQSRSPSDAQLLMDSCPARYATAVIGEVQGPAPALADGAPIP